MKSTSLLKVCAGISSILFLQACGSSYEQHFLDQANNIANKIVPNTINPSALDPSGLNPNALSPSTLHPDTLDAHSLEAILDPGMAGTLSRSLVHYLVGCSFSPGQTFSFTWTDGNGVAHDENYEGILALAPEWATGALAPAHEALVSGCIASRVNYYGLPVEISSRAPESPLDAPDAAEKVAYSKIEGAFWGNLFAETPWVRSCGVGANAANSRLWHRDCAAGHPDGNGGTTQCGIMDIVGDCETVCDPLDTNNKYYAQCNDAQNGVQLHPITTALPIAAVAGSPANLELVTSGPTSATTGACSTITYTSTVTNTGSVTALAPVFSDFIPVGLTLKSVTTTMGSCTPMGGAVTCNLPDMSAGAVATIVIETSPTTTNVLVSNFTTLVSPTVESVQTDNTFTLSTQLQPSAGSWSQITQGFNNTPIAAGTTIWFTATIDADSEIPAGTIWADPGTITFQAEGVTYNIPVPAGRVNLQNSAGDASTSFDDVLRRWTTTVPTSSRLSPTLMTAVGWVAPVDLPGGIQSVTMSMRLSSSQPDLTVGWSWSAAAYSSFSRNYGALQVVPTDDTRTNPYDNDHKAGSPESQLGGLVAGALGGGGSQYVGERPEPVRGTPAASSCN